MPKCGKPSNECSCQKAGWLREIMAGGKEFDIFTEKDKRHS